MFTERAVVTVLETTLQSSGGLGCSGRYGSPGAQRDVLLPGWSGAEPARRSVQLIGPGIPLVALRSFISRSGSLSFELAELRVHMQRSANKRKIRVVNTDFYDIPSPAFIFNVSARFFGEGWGQSTSPRTLQRQEC